MNTNESVTQEYLKELFKYEPETGNFIRIKRSLNNKFDIGTIAGRLNQNGYVNIKINDKLYKVHRLAWLYTYGVWPIEFIDHINGIKHDNRLCNLREATRADNGKNRIRFKSNISGFVGVSWYPRYNKWHSCITVDKKKMSLGYHLEINDAVNAYHEAATKYFGEFYVKNRENLK